MDSSSLTQIKRKSYDVYPSFCAPDVGRSFVSHLRTLFASKGITMYNDHGIERGHTIGPEVVRAIRDSQVSIVVLSKNYPSSIWCLDELAEILKLNKAPRQIVIPIYYNIDHSHVWELSGSFGSAFTKTCEGQPEEVKQRWSRALTDITNIVGENTQNWDNESDMIQKIAKYVLNIVNARVSRDFDRMVGLNAHLEKLETLLSLNSGEVKMIGIWGPAGIGKTTIARALFNQFFNGFNLSCFMENLEGDNQSAGANDYDSKLRLQNQLLSKILNQRDLRIHHLGAIKERLQHQRVFIILDGVCDLEELDALAKDVSWFGYGSWIIVTTEDRDILWSHGISDIYYVDFPTEKEAIEILCLYAFKQSSERDGFEKLASKAAKLCGNLPLGLSVAGSSLRGKSKHEWELQLSRMETSLNRKVEAILRVGYDRLGKKAQLIFIHIACFFNNKTVDYVTTMLANKNLDVRIGLRILADNSLVQISTNGRIVMHSLLQQFGRQIVLKQSNEPGKHQFSVELEEIHDELENETVSSYKSTTIAPNRKHSNDDWYSFCEFLSNRMPFSTPTRCSAHDVIDFLRTLQVSGGEAEALVSRLSAKSEEYGIKPEENPLRSLAVTSYLKAEREKIGETESILVFSCNDNFDPDKTSFINSILKELHKREVTPLTYNILEKKNLDEEMLCKSSVGIIILSDSYACSRQSLDHLVEIMEHWKATDLVIIPVYFKVTVSDICGLKGRFEAALLQLHQSSLQEDRVQKWKAAVNEIVSIGGLVWTKGTQLMLVEEVVRNACIRLYIKNSKNLARILSLLNHSQFSDAEFFGIWGMAGVGKTSIAREVFGILSPQYDVCYFLQDFYLMCQKKGLRQMRDDFFSKVFGEEKLSVGACDIKPSFMKDWFCNKTILVVLDDVSNARDAEAVVGGFGWFSHGHRIILTSRRKQVLLQCKVKEPYEIQRLGDFESFRLCKQYLNGESEVIPQLVSCSSGIPLALEVLGSSLSKQHINNMVEHLKKLRLNPPKQIQETFRRSFDGLDENEKSIFLDLACFFKGENVDDVVQLLDACGFFTYLGVCNLINESLISLVDDRIKMPIPFQDIGRFIVLEEDEDPCERSRLWDSNDITQVLRNNSGTEAIEGIFLDASDMTCELSPTVFSEMYRLRLLKFYCSTSGSQCKLSLPQGLDTLPDELRLLHWENYPLECLPQNFIPENLVEISMPYSNMKKLWEGKKNLDKLKKIKLSHSRNLTDILMFSEALNVEHIDLEGCTGLVDISTSIPRCGKLVSLNMKDCSGLRTLPAMVDLTSLKLLNLSGCSKLEEIHDFAPNLKELYLAGTAIRELLLSIENLNELVTLDLENCTRLLQLPFGIRNSKSIVELNLSGCTSLGL